MTQVEGPAATVGAMMFGFGFCVAVVLAFVALIQFRDWLDDRRAASEEQAAKSADAARSMAAAYVPHPMDVAKVEIEHPVNMPGVVVRNPPLKKDMPGRLVDHAQKYRKASK